MVDQLINHITNLDDNTYNNLPNVANQINEAENALSEPPELDGKGLFDMQGFNKFKTLHGQD
jgi:hypothetical protein